MAKDVLGSAPQSRIQRARDESSWVGQESSVCETATELARIACGIAFSPGAESDPTGEG